MEMNRIDSTFAACRRENRKALVMFVSAGDPSLEFTERLIPQMVSAGADVIEIGVPFSDPMADGPVIQAASQRALKAGTNLPRIMAMVGRLRQAGLEAPFVLFSYYNVILQYGVERLADDSHRCGVDGWLVVDLSAEEEDEVVPVLEQRGLHKITLLAPTTPPSRLAKLAGRAKGFVYYITVKGVTGTRAELPADLAGHLREVVRLSSAPVVAGFGVATPGMARQVAAFADGVVVGSKLVRTIAESADEDTGIAKAVELVGDLAKALSMGQDS